MSRTALALAAAVVAVAGCADDSTVGADPGQPPSATATTGVISPQDLPEVPALRAAQGVAADADFDCPVDPGQQTVEGTITNTAKRKRDFVIALSWTNDEYDVLGRAVAVVRDLPAGRTRTWKATGEVAEEATLCVPNIQRGSL